MQGYPPNYPPNYGGPGQDYYEEPMMPMPMTGSMPPMYGPEQVYYEDPQYMMAPVPQVQYEYVDMPQPVYMPPPPQMVYMPPPPPVNKPPPPKPVAPPRPQGNSCRSMCLVVSGVIMFICGVIIMALPFYAAELPTKAIDKQCDATKNSCKTGLGKLDVASLTKYDKINCYTDLKISWGCTCTPSATIACNKPDQFSCKGADGTKYYLAQLYEWWDEGMWIIGGVGLFVCILFIAVPAFLGSVKGAGAVVAYSVCCSIFFIPFLFIGACFLVVGGAFDKKPHLAVDDTLTNLCSSVPSDNHCGTRIWCKALDELRTGDHQIQATAIVAGVAFVVAGFTQLIGMFVCCCCKAPAPQKTVYQAPMPVQTIMMEPQPIYATPAPQPAMMMMYPEPMMQQPMIQAYPEPYDYGVPGYDYGPYQDYGPGRYAPARGQA